MKECFEGYIQLRFYEDEQRKQRIQESKDRHKEKKCASVQVFLERKMVEAFKALVKQNGHNQAGVIRGFIESYMSSYISGSDGHGAY